MTDAYLVELLTALGYSYYVDSGVLQLHTYVRNLYDMPDTVHVSVHVREWRRWRKFGVLLQGTWYLALTGIQVTVELSAGHVDDLPHTSQ